MPQSLRASEAVRRASRLVDRRVIPAEGQKPYLNSLESAAPRMDTKGAPPGLAVGTMKAPRSSFFVRVWSPFSHTR